MFNVFGYTEIILESSKNILKALNDNHQEMYIFTVLSRRGKLSKRKKHYNKRNFFNPNSLESWVKDFHQLWSDPPKYGFQVFLISKTGPS